MIGSPALLAVVRDIAKGAYTSGQIDVSVWAEAIEADYLRWREE